MIIKSDWRDKEIEINKMLQDYVEIKKEIEDLKKHLRSRIIRASIFSLCAGSFQIWAMIHHLLQDSLLWIIFFVLLAMVAESLRIFWRAVLYQIKKTRDLEFGLEQRKSLFIATYFDPPF